MKIKFFTEPQCDDKPLVKFDIGIYKTPKYMLSLMKEEIMILYLVFYGSVYGVDIRRKIK